MTFSNAWGACDEDLLRWTLDEADRAHERAEPFHFFVMTTSNHRPYTYPEGRIDLPSKVSGRAGAVKYTDWAIGDFLAQASERPWFENTIFVIVADHCAASAGRAEIPLNRYHIPLMVFAPGGQVVPGVDSTLMSQMDYAPTLLGLLNWSYPSRFFGHDVRRIEPSAAHALVGTHELLGHLEEDVLTILGPRQQHSAFDVDPRTLEQSSRPCGIEDVHEVVAFYETASGMLSRGQYRALDPAETALYAEAGRRALEERDSAREPSTAGE